MTTLGGLAKQVKVKKIKRKFATFDFMSSVFDVVLYKAMQTLVWGAILDSSFVSLFCNIITSFEHIIFVKVRTFISLSGEAFKRVQKLKLNERKLSYVDLQEMECVRYG